MLTIRQRQRDELARRRRIEEEPGWVFASLRGTYAEALSGVGDDLLRTEIRACLDRCDQLGIDSDGDRLGFCMLDIVGFPGFRDRPEIPSMLARCREGDGSLLVCLCLQVPAEFWNRLLEEARAVRAQRGMP